MNVICVENGNYCGRGAEYVAALARGLTRFCKRSFTLYCYTDRPGNVPDVHYVSGPGIGYWDKLVMFSEFRTGANLYLDLDVIPTGDLSPVFDLGADFARVYKPGSSRPVSDVLYWQGDHSDIFANWVAKKTPQDIRTGDAGFIDSERPNAKDISKLVPGCFEWFNLGRPFREYLKWKPAPETRAVILQGLPRPHNLAPSSVLYPFWRD